MTHAVTYYMWTQCHWVGNYFNDIIGVLRPADASDTLQTLSKLLEALGLPINFKKVEESASEITFLGIDINVKTKILTICQDTMFKIKKN